MSLNNQGIKQQKAQKVLGKMIDARNKLFDKYLRMPIETEKQILARNNVVRRLNEYDAVIKPQKSGIVLPA